MSTIPIEVSTEQLLRAVERLPAEELNAFAAQVLALRAQRGAPSLTRNETALLLQINASLAPEVQARYDDLVTRREAETITPEELHELIFLTDAVEKQDAERLTALRELAELRHQTVPELMDALGLPRREDA
ncbi:MAG: STAS/SEC14 domain-containing protein [Chloroflexales bacterium]|nr:STAS/SEC14 domain-containing protein [Chloroflexales bacterium]